MLLFNLKLRLQYFQEFFECQCLTNTSNLFQSFSFSPAPQVTSAWHTVPQNKAVVFSYHKRLKKGEKKKKKDFNSGNFGILFLLFIQNKIHHFEISLAIEMWTSLILETLKCFNLIK